MVWRNLLTKSHQVFRIYIIHHPFCNYYDIYISKTKQKNYNTMYFNLFSLFFSTTTYFVLYLVWYVYDNTYNSIVDYSQFISRVFLLSQLWIVNYNVKSLPNDLSNKNITLCVSREMINITKIVHFGILINVLSCRQQNHQCLFSLLRLFDEIFWCNNLQSIIDVLEILGFYYFFSMLFQELIFKIWDWFSGELKLAPPSKSIHTVKSRVLTHLV